MRRSVGEKEEMRWNMALRGRSYQGYETTSWRRCKSKSMDAAEAHRVRTGQRAKTLSLDVHWRVRVFVSSVQDFKTLTKIWTCVKIGPYQHSILKRCKHVEVKVNLTTSLGQPTKPLNSISHGELCWWDRLEAVLTPLRAQGDAQFGRSSKQGTL
jgi:hypothetical protein